MRSFPPRTIKTSIEAIRDSNAKTGATKIQKITFETVDAELGNGHFSVLGSNIATTGDGTNVHAGQQVPVGWNESAPAVIIDHHAQAAQGIRPLPAGGEVVEELFIATNPASGSLDVWFRNLSQVTPLGLTQFLHPDPTLSYLDTVQWGLANDRFLLFQTSTMHSSPIFVFKLNRRPNTQYAIGTIAKATLDATYTLDSILGSAVTVSYQSANFDNNVFGTPSGNQFTVPSTNLGFGLTSVKYFFHNDTTVWNTIGTGTVQNALAVTSTPIQLVLDERAHLIVVYDVIAGDSAFAAFLGQFETTMIADVTAAPPIVIQTPPSARAIGANQTGTMWRQSSTPIFVLAGNERVAVVTQATMPAPTVPGNFLSVNIANSPYTFLIAAGRQLQNGVLSEAFASLFSRTGLGSQQWQATRRHVLWFDTNNNVFILNFDPGSSAVSPTVGSAVQIGSGPNLVSNFFSTTVGTLTFPIRLLLPDFLYDSRNASGLFFVQGGWSILSPSSISPVVDSKDQKFGSVGNMKKLPAALLVPATTTFAPYPEQPGVFVLERGMAWQIIDDPQVLRSIQRFVPPVVQP